MAEIKKQKIFVAFSPKQSLPEGKLLAFYGAGRDAAGPARNRRFSNGAGQAGGFKKRKVLVAMSGGVDSSVAAALLKKAGFPVIGVFMRLWQDNLLRKRKRRCLVEAEKRARLVASILKIPFYILNLEKEFKKRVVNYFLREYKRGSTPNPCVVCNKEIKCGLLLKKAVAMGANFVATGHYVRLRRKILNPKSQIQSFQLFRGKDREKDQSYFLWQLSQNQLRRIIFPLGGLTKREVVSFAKKLKLPVLNIKESQEICFIKTTINDFLKRYLKGVKRGKITDPKGKILGIHGGLPFYTIGQRKGIRLAGGPFYVLGKDQKRNILIVTKKEKDLNKKELTARDVNWISGKEPRLRQGYGGQVKLRLKIKAKIRYRQKLAPAVIRIADKKRIKVFFSKPQRAITPGQSVVFYKGEELLGGGIIDR